MNQYCLRVKGIDSINQIPVDSAERGTIRNTRLRYSAAGNPNNPDWIALAPRGAAPFDECRALRHRTVEKTRSAMSTMAASPQSSGNSRTELRSIFGREPAIASDMPMTTGHGPIGNRRTQSALHPPPFVQ